MRLQVRLVEPYQADLLRDLDQGDGLSPEAVKELRKATDLAFHTTKQMVHAFCCYCGDRKASVAEPVEHKG